MAEPLLLLAIALGATLSVASTAASRAPVRAFGRPPTPAAPLCPTQPSPDAPKYVEQINVTKCARGCADLPQCASVTPGGVCLQKCSFPQFPADTGRRLMAWVGGDGAWDTLPVCVSFAVHEGPRAFETCDPV